MKSLYTVKLTQREMDHICFNLGFAIGKRLENEAKYGKPDLKSTNSILRKFDKAKGTK